MTQKQKKPKTTPIKVYYVHNLHLVTRTFALSIAMHTSKCILAQMTSTSRQIGFTKSTARGWEQIICKVASNDQLLLLLLLRLLLRPPSIIILASRITRNFNEDLHQWSKYKEPAPFILYMLILLKSAVAKLIFLYSHLRGESVWIILFFYHY